jgi:hypothetical protein
MKNQKVIMKCCVCGRVKTDNGWEYQFRKVDSENLCSHGFCMACYELEIKKVRMQAVLPAMASYQ